MMDPFRLIIEGRLFDITHFEEVSDTVDSVEIVLGLLPGMEPGRYETITTYKKYLVTIEFQDVQSLIHNRMVFGLVSDQGPQMIDGFIRTVNQGNEGMVLNMEAMPTSKTRFVPDIGEPTEWK